MPRVPGPPPEKQSPRTLAGRAPRPPCVVHEDEHLLVVVKPAGWNTHRPAPHGGEGIYEWLRDREPRWAGLAIVHRLDRETSGLLVFAKTPLASSALTAQFARREVLKRYELLTDRPAPRAELRVETGIVRSGGRYRAVAGGRDALTVFRPGARRGAHSLVVAEPRTGRTHQIRVHAALRGFPVLGDALYGGSPARRLHLHAAGLVLRHPASGERLQFESAADFAADPATALRAAFIDPGETDAYRLVHGAADGRPGLYADRLGEYLLLQSEREPSAADAGALLAGRGLRGAYAKRLSRDVRRLGAAEASPRHLAGSPAPARFPVRENGVLYELGFTEGYSVGLFLDQRDNRRRLLTNHVGAGFGPVWEAGSPAVLNAFAYTCGFSVCAALAGAVVTSLDLSRRYLDWGRRNFVLNGLDGAAHEFVQGDAFEWLRRMARKGRRFDVLLLDPPTFSRSKSGGHFSVVRDYPRLLAAALPLLRRDGVLFASTNAARLAPGAFVAMLEKSAVAAGRRIRASHYAPQPPDFPVTRAEAPHLKTCWLRLADAAL